jgi:hypothetical protein
MSTFHDRLNYAHTLAKRYMDAGDYDQAERIINNALANVPTGEINAAFAKVRTHAQRRAANKQELRDAGAAAMRMRTMTTRRGKRKTTRHRRVRPRRRHYRSPMAILSVNARLRSWVQANLRALCRTGPTACSMITRI